MSIRKNPNLGLNYRTPECLLKTAKILSNSSEKTYQFKSPDYFEERRFSNQSETLSQNIKKNYNKVFDAGSDYFKNRSEDEIQQNSRLFKANKPPTNQDYFQNFTKNLEIYKVDSGIDQQSKDIRSFGYSRHLNENDALFFKEEFENHPLIFQERNKIFSNQVIINFIFTTISGIFSYWFCNIFLRMFFDYSTNDLWDDFRFILMLIILLFIRSLRFTSKFF